MKHRKSAVRCIQQGVCPIRRIAEQHGEQWIEGILGKGQGGIYENRDSN